MRLSEVTRISLTHDDVLKMVTKVLRRNIPKEAVVRIEDPTDDQYEARGELAESIENARLVITWADEHEE